MKNIPKKLLLLVLTLVIGITLVACGNNKDEEAVKNAVANTTVQTEASANFDLPAKDGDVTIVWTVSGSGLTLGTVADGKQPVTVTQTDSDQTATLKAAFKLNKASDEKTFTVKIKAKTPVGKTDAEKVADAVAKVKVAEEATVDFDVPTKEGDVAINWTIEGNGLKLGTAANNKLPVVVTRADADQLATLKAVFTLGQETTSKNYVVKVLKKDVVLPTDEEIVAGIIEDFVVLETTDKDFSLATKVDDVTITWTAQGDGVELGIVAEGMQPFVVTRANTDQDVTLSATFKLNGYTTVEIYEVTISKFTEVEIVYNAIANVIVPTEVDEDFHLPTVIDGVEITWTTDGNGLTLGTVVEGKQPVTVTRTELDQTAKLIAVFTLGQETEDKEYTVKVLLEEPSEEDIVDGVKADYDVPETVTEDFTLDTKVNGVEISFEVAGEGIVKGDVVEGKQTFIVTRTSVNQVVTIEATFTLNDVEVKEEYTITVTKNELPVGPQTARAYFEGDTIGFAKDETSNNAELINLDKDVFNVTGTLSGSYQNPIGLNKDGTIRLYSVRQDGFGGSLLTLKVKEGFKITKVEYVFAEGIESPDSAEAKFGSTVEKLVAADLVDTTLTRENLSIDGFSLENTFYNPAAAKNAQITIKEIKITYEVGTPESILGGGDVDPELTDQEKVNLAIADVNFANKELREDTTLDLLKKGLHDVIISWEATTGEEYINLETGKVTLPTTPGTYDLVLDATFKLGDVVESFEYTFELIVPELLGVDFIIHEGFEDAGLPSAYGNNTFIGNKDVVFTYSGARDEDTFGIENKGILFRGKTGEYNPSLNFKVNGLSLLYFEYRKAFTGAAERQLELYINDELVQTTDLFGAGSGDQKDVYTFIYDVKHLEEVNVSIGVATNGQVTIDNLYVYGPEAVVPKLHTVNFDTVDRDVEILDGTQVRLPDAPKSPVNYEFAGWTLDGVLYDFDLPVTTDLNLVAKFELVHADVTTLEELNIALENEKIRTIKLVNDITIDKTIIIDREVALDGNGNKLIMIGDASDWNGLYIIQVYNTLSVFIENLGFQGGNAAILVNGSIVEISNLTFSGQGFGGIEVSQGEGVTAEPRLTIDGIITHTLGDLPVIWIDGKTTNDGWVDTTIFEKLIKDDKNQLWFMDKEDTDLIVEFTETFDNITDAITGSSYTDGSFAGVNGQIWDLTKSRPDQSMTGKSWTTETGSLKTTFKNGLKYISFDYVRAFTGTGQRSFEVFINDIKRDTITVSPDSDKVEKYVLDNIDLEGEVTFEIRGIGKQKKLDNLFWAESISNEEVTTAEVANLDELLTALANDVIETITLTADIETSSQIVIDREVAILGGNHKITATGVAGTWSGLYAIHVYNTQGVYIENIEFVDGNAAMLINGSTVEVKGLSFVGQGFGGIEVSQGEGVTAKPELTVDGPLVFDFTDLPVIWLDKVTVNDGWVIVDGLEEVIKDDQVWFVEQVQDEVTTAEVSNLDELLTALANDVIETITLTADIETSSQIVIDREVAILGGNHKITATGVAGTWSGLYALHVYKAQGVYIENVEFVGGNAAMLINGSTVEVKGLSFVGQGFGGIEVSQGEGVTAKPELTVDGPLVFDFTDLPVIWLDKVTVNDGWVTVDGLVEVIKDDQVWFVKIVKEIITVTFMVDEEVYATVEVGENGLVTLPATDPVKEGFTFVGWFIGENEFDFDTLITEAITLTAHWEEAEPEEPGDEVEVTTEYIFTSKSWGTSQDDWTSGKDGLSPQSGSGIQVSTGASGANGTTKITFYNVKSIEITYATNASKGAGTIVTKVGNETVQTFTVSTGGGTTKRSAGVINVDSLDGAITITVNCTTNSIYLYGIKIVHTES